MKIPGSTRLAAVVAGVVLVAGAGLPAAGASATPSNTPNSLDPLLVGNGRSTRVRAMVRDVNVLYIGGDFGLVDGEVRQNLAAIDLTTGHATGWNPGADGDVHTLAIDGTGDSATIYVGGGFDSLGGESRQGLGAVPANSDTATSWNPGASGSVRTLAIDGTGDSATIYAGGEFSTLGGEARQYLGAVSADTGTATSWNPWANNSVNALAIDGTGDSATIYAGGDFDSLGGESRASLGAVPANSDTATNWNPGASGGVRTLAIDGTGDSATIYVGGDFSTLGSESREKLGAVSADTGTATLWNPGVSGEAVHAIALHGTEASATVYVGGYFVGVGGATRFSLGAVPANSDTATSWDPALAAAGGVWATARIGDTLILGGTFDTVQGQPRQGLAAIDLRTGLVTSWNPDTDGGVTVLAADGDGPDATIYVGGQFSTLGGASRQNLGAVRANSNTATSWNPGTEGFPFRLILDGTGASATIYVAGYFSTLGGASRQGLGALRANSDAATSWNPGTNGYVYGLALDGTGPSATVYVGGYFTSLGGAPRQGLGAVPASSDAATSWDPASEPAWVRALALDGTGPSATVYVGGLFTALGGASRTNLSAVSANTGQATSWNPGTSGNSSQITDQTGVWDLALDGSGPSATVYVGGAFTTLGSAPRFALGSVPASSNLATAWNPNPGNNSVVARAAVDRSAESAQLFVGGQFSELGGLTRLGFAAFDLAATPAPAPTPAPTPTPTTDGGYRLAAADGGIFAYGNAEFSGSAGALGLTKPVVGIAPTPSGHGYWLAGSDGGVFAYGDADFYGSAGALALTKPIVGIAPTPSGHGYWLAASDGGVFAYGDAVFQGSTGGSPLNKPIVGMA